MAHRVHLYKSYSKLRVKAVSLLTRHRGASTFRSTLTMSTLNFGPFVMDLEGERVLRAGRALDLRPRAFQALRTLLLNSGQYVSRDRIIVDAWKGAVVSPHTVSVTISEVRKSLGEYQSWITHRPDTGYRLQVPGSEDLIRRGWHFWSQHTRTGFEEALASFAQAAESASGDFRAYEGIASCHLMLAGLGMSAPWQARPAFRDAQRHAIELNGGVTPEARCDAAHALHIFDVDYARAELAFEAARHETPTLITVYTRLALLYYACGRFDAAMSAVQEATRLDPLAPGIATVEAYIWLGRRQYDVALSCARRAVALHPYSHLTHSIYGQLLELTECYEDALVQYRLASTFSPDLSYVLALEGVCLARAGRSRDALAQLQRLDAQRRTCYVDAYGVAVLLTALGAHEQALKELERAGDERSSALNKLLADPHLDPLRAYSRFERVRERMLSTATATH
jgi:DNA-binding winged helix-turn-helix (wHTH) protein/Flp pilus assembly protein TadD